MIGLGWGLLAALLIGIAGFSYLAISGHAFYGALLLGAIATGSNLILDRVRRR